MNLPAALSLYLDQQIPVLRFDPLGVTGNLFEANLPSRPSGDPTVDVSVTAYGGPANLTRQPTSLRTVQFRARGPEYDPRPARQILEQIHGVLAGLDSTDLPDGDGDQVHIVTCDPLQDAPFPIGQDDNRRHEFTQNWTLRIHAPTTHRPAIPA